MKNGLSSHFDGNFKYCSKDKCEKSCCDPKNWNSSSIPHYPFDTLNLHNQAQRINKKIGKEIIKVDMWTKNMSGCSKDKKCLFEESKPITCKIFPLSISPTSPMRGETDKIKLGTKDEHLCPQVKKITEDVDFIINAIEFLTSYFQCQVELVGVLKNIEPTINDFFNKTAL